MRIARVALGDRIDLVDVPRDERAKGLLAIAFDVFPHQNDVIKFLHRGNAADAGKVTRFFGRRNREPGKLARTHNNADLSTKRPLARFFIEVIFKVYKLKPGGQFCSYIQRNYNE